MDSAKLNCSVIHLSKDTNYVFRRTSGLRLGGGFRGVFRFPPPFTNRLSRLDRKVTKIKIPNPSYDLVEKVTKIKIQNSKS